MLNLILWVVLIIIVGFIVWKLITSYKYQYGHVVLFSGAPGKGKTLAMVKEALKTYYKNYRNVKIKNWFRKVFGIKKREEIPIIISNFPIKTRGTFRAKEFSYKLKIEHILLLERLPMKSVIVISEYASIVDNMSWDNPLARINIDEQIRFIRQYLKGGYMFMDEQASDAILIQARRRIGSVYNMVEYKKIPLLPVYRLKIRNLSISEDIKVVEDANKEDMSTHRFGVHPFWPFAKSYDTYAFSERYVTVPKGELTQYKGYKTNHIMSLPNYNLKSNLESYKHLLPKTTDEENT